MIEKVIKHYQKLTDLALKNLAEGKDFTFKFDENLIANNVKEFKSLDSSELSKTLILDYENDMRKMINRANKEYRKVLNQLNSTDDEQAKQQILRRFSDSGIIGFEAKNGAKWNIETYSNMYTRHVNNECVRNNVIKMAKDQGRKVIKISIHGTICHLCKPWEGKTLTFEELEYAKSKGLFHPNCLHIVLFVVERIVV